MAYRARKRKPKRGNWCMGVADAAQTAAASAAVVVTVASGKPCGKPMASMAKQGGCAVLAKGPPCGDQAHKLGVARCCSLAH